MFVANLLKCNFCNHLIKLHSCPYPKFQTLFKRGFRFDQVFFTEEKTSGIQGTFSGHWSQFTGEKMSDW